MIHRTTNRAISRAVGIALENGYSIAQLARGVPTADPPFPGLRSILTETENRSRLIARTESNEDAKSDLGRLLQRTGL
jgi:hypothetical protein